MNAVKIVPIFFKSQVLNFGSCLKGVFEYTGLNFCYVPEQVQHLQKVLTKKRDPVSHVCFIDEIIKVRWKI